MPTTASSDEILRELVDHGVSPQTIVIIAQLLASEQHELARRERNRVRMRLVRERARTQVHSSAQPLSLSPQKERELPSRLEPSGSNLSGRAKRKPKVPLPDDFNPVVREQDAIELDHFKDHARAIDRRCADWDAAWRNWLRSPYRKPNGGHGNGNGRRHGSALDACDRLEQQLDLKGAGEYVPRSSEVDHLASTHGYRRLSKG